jgi:serine phosphatase RsbU (regulator of sigma subunit)
VARAEETASPFGSTPRGRERWDASIVVPVVLVACLGLTAVVAWASWSQYRSSRDRLLVVQTRQAAEVIAAAIPGSALPLSTAAQLAAATGGNRVTVARYLRAYVAPIPNGLIGAALWHVRGGRVTTLLTLGRPRDARLARPLARRIALRALRTTRFVVVGLLHGRSPPRLGFADGVRSSKGAYVIYAERALPRDRRARVGSNIAFDQLHYAIYLGAPVLANLLTSDVTDGPVPSGRPRISIPYGTASLTLVTAPAGPLAGALPSRQPWVIVAIGVLLSILAALLAQVLVSRRRLAERDAAAITALNDQLTELYAEQRTIALTLQRSLLPARLPTIPGVDVAVRYQPGSEGEEIGGDWYSVVAIDDDRFGFVVGDVSGRGVRAAATMAALRFTIRTLVLEGHDPSRVLDTCVRQTSEMVRGHLATVLVCVGDLRRGTISIGNAGHLRPLQVVDGRATFLDVAVGVPLGAPGPGYVTTVVEAPPGSTLVAFTDGLVERRNENLEAGLRRLVASVERAPSDLEQLVESVCGDLTAGSDDDVAILAVRWCATAPTA